MTTCAVFTYQALLKSLFFVAAILTWSHWHVYIYSAIAPIMQIPMRVAAAAAARLPVNLRV